MAKADGKPRFTERIDVLLAKSLKALGLLAIAALGLLFGACSTAMLLTGYKATILFNDTTELRAECQMADSLKPEIDWIGPGEAMLAHSGRYCAVHAADGAYYGCVRRNLIANADGATVRVSEALDTDVSRADCGGVMITRSFEPESFQADLSWPSQADQRGTAWMVMGYIIGAGLIGLAVFLGVHTRTPPAGANG